MFEILKSLVEDGGATFKNGKAVTYKTGWQVATEGVEAATPEAALAACEGYEGNCGVWLHEGIYYIDRSQRVTRKCDAVKLGRECNQQSILKWQNMSLLFLN